MVVGHNKGASQSTCCFAPSDTVHKTCCATSQPNSKQRRSALRSAARHQKIARRVRCAVLAVRFVQRLKRMQVKQVKPVVTTLVPRDVSSPASPNSPTKRKLEAASADSPGTRSSTHTQVAAILFAGSATELRPSYVSGPTKVAEYGVRG